MRHRSVPSEWIRNNGGRLDCQPFLSGAVEARVTIESGNFARQPLQEVTKGYKGGIYNGPQFARIYVSGPEHGVPFLGSSSMLRADLSNLPYIRRKDAESRKLSYLRLEAGTTLISCSGTIGRMVYARPDMEGMWTSQDIMKVEPDPDKIPPGYLYAFLSSKYGVPLVTSGTYGAIIQHIEPAHIADLPVPRLSSKVEAKVDELIVKSAALRAKAAENLALTRAEFDVQFIETSAEISPKISRVLASDLANRMDAQYHDPESSLIKEKITSVGFSTIGNYCDRISLPGIFKRIYTESPDHGAPYFTGASLFWLEPVAKGTLSKATSLFDQVLLSKGVILIQAFGQDGGLTGRPVWVGENLAGTTTTHMLVRLVVNDQAAAHYLFGFLNSNSAYRQIRCLTYGGSIPHFDAKNIHEVLIPELSPARRDKVIAWVREAVGNFDDALSLERQATTLVEQQIEEAA